MSGYTLFISDLHLQQELPAITHKFIDFLQREAANADALYILGDFFEAWIGDDDHTPFHKKITILLKKLTDDGVPIYFMHGNRDFMLGREFAKRCGMQLLPDPTPLIIYGLRILISHGDILCTLDRRHQKYRRVVSHPVTQKILLTIPLWLRRRIARKLRQQSQRYHQNIPNHISDVNPIAVEQMMKQYAVPLFIHGHTHRPKIHEVKLDETLARRIVLGAWHDNSDYLKLSHDGRYELKVFL